MTVEEHVRTHFTSGDIVRVTFVGEPDGDGETICKVNVVYNGGEGELNVSEMLSLAVRLRPLTEAILEGSGYPVISFSDSRELDALHAAE